MGWKIGVSGNEKTREIIEELTHLRETMEINKHNKFRDNDKKTKQEVEDYLDKKWEEVSL